MCDMLIFLFCIKKDKIRSLELEFLKSDQKYSDLQSELLSCQKTKRFLQSNFSCIYSKIVHKCSNEYLNEIQSLRKLNEEMHNKLSEEEIAVRNVFKQLSIIRTQAKTFQLQVQNQENLIEQLTFASSNNNATFDHKSVIVGWQKKCTNAEIKLTQFTSENSSLKDEIQFLRNQSQKYLSNIGSLQHKLCETTNDLQAMKQEMSNSEFSLQPIIEQVSQSIQIPSDSKFIAENDSKQDNISKNIQTETIAILEQQQKMHLHEKESGILQSKIFDLQEMIRVLQSESKNTESRVNNATNGLQVMLRTAQETIASLQLLVSQKTDAIENYREMMNKLVTKSQVQQNEYQINISTLQQKINEQENAMSEQMFHFMHVHRDRNEMNMKSDTVPIWVKISQLRSTIQEKANIIQRLEKRNSELHDVQQLLEKESLVMQGRMKYLSEELQESQKEKQSLNERFAKLKLQLMNNKQQKTQLQNAVMCLKQSIEDHELSQIPIPQKSDDGHSQTGNVNDYNLANYKLMKNSLQSQIQKLNHTIMENEQMKHLWMDQKMQMEKEMQKMKQNLESAKEMARKYENLYQKTHREKNSLQERHFQATKMHKKRMQSLQKRISEQEQKNDMKSLTNESPNTINKHTKLLKFCSFFLIFLIICVFGMLDNGQH